MIVNKQLAINY